MDQLDAMRAFLAVADRGSFAAAARALRLSPAAATRAVALLEDDLGLSLFNRTTRSVRLTERGAVYAERCRQILAEIEDARSLVRGEDAAPRGQLSVTAPLLFGRLHILPIAETLGAAFPDLVLKLTFVDRVTHLVEEGFDIAVRIGSLADSALVAIKVAQVRRVTVASPDYIDRHGAPETVAALREHRIISFDGVGSTDEWRFGPDSKVMVKVEPSLSVNCADSALIATERGHGVCRLLSYQVRDALAQGKLVRLLIDDEPPPVPVSLVYQAARRSSANIQAFVREARMYFSGLELV